MRATGKGHSQEPWAAQSPGRREELVWEGGRRWGWPWRGRRKARNRAVSLLLPTGKYGRTEILSLLTDIGNPAGGCRYTHLPEAEDHGPQAGARVSEAPEILALPPIGCSL